MLLNPVSPGKNMNQSTLTEDCVHHLLGLVPTVEVLPKNLDCLMFLLVVGASEPAAVTPTRQMTKHQFHKGVKIPTIEVPFLVKIQLRMNV